MGHGKHDTSNQGGIYQGNGISSSYKKYNLPRSTLYDYVRLNWDPFQATQWKLGRKPIIPPAPEEKPFEYLLLIERKYFGCTRDDVRRLVFQLAVQNKIPSPFSIAKEAAGKDWFRRCMKRHSDELSLRQPTGTSTAQSRRIQQGTSGDFLWVVRKRACCSWIPTFTYFQRSRNWFNSGSRETNKNPRTQRQTSDWRFNCGIKVKGKSVSLQARGAQRVPGS